MSTTIDHRATSSYRLLSKNEFADLLGCTTRTVDRMLSDRQIPAWVVTRIPAGVRGNTKTKFILARAIEWIESLTGSAGQNAGDN